MCLNHDEDFLSAFCSVVYGIYMFVLYSCNGSMGSWSQKTFAMHEMFSSSVRLPD